MESVVVQWQTDLDAVRIISEESSGNQRGRSAMQCEFTWAAPFWDDRASRKHRRPSKDSRRNWNRSILALGTIGAEPAVYNPHLSRDEIRRVEMECVMVEGVAQELPRSICHIRRFYRRFEAEVGACEGAKTKYIFVQYGNNGSVHGYPASEAYLRKKGAPI
jgi:hypothetical protein